MATTGRPIVDNSPKWIVRLICCGREDGLYGPVYSWQEADNFREAYCTGVGTGENGHLRVGIIEEFK